MAEPLINTAIKPLLLYLATSKKKEIRAGGAVTRYEWGSYLSWTNFKSPVAYSNKKVKYDKTTKNKVGKSKYGGLGGSTHYGTYIPATKQVTIAGVTRTVDVRYYQRGYTKYTRTTELKKDKKMRKQVYTASKPYQYRLQLKDKPVYEKQYSQYVDGEDYIFFADFWYIGSVKYTRSNHLPHPIAHNLTYFDVNRNQDTSAANNSDERDNYGKYVLSKVRANVVQLELEWSGLELDDGRDLLDTLCPDKEHPYVIAQFYDSRLGYYRRATFYASERTAEQYSNGIYKSIKVTLTEV